MRCFRAVEVYRLARSVLVSSKSCPPKASSIARLSPSTKRWLSQSLPVLRKQDISQQDELQKDKQKHVRSSAIKTSLRRVSMEAERSRLIISRGGIRFLAPDAETKKATAYCAAEQYNLHIASRLIKADGFELDPHRTGLYPQVIHVQTPTSVSGPSPRLEQTEQQAGDIFIFPSGTVVAWNVLEKEALRLVERVLPPAAVNSHSGFVEIEKEDLEYIEDSTAERCSILGDTIIIGIKSDSRASDVLVQRYTDGDRQHPSQTFIPAPEVDTVLAKIAFSSGLARSTKLAVLERLTDTYFASTRSIPTILSRGTPLPFNKPRILRRLCEMLGLGSRLPFSRPFILRKTGELLSIRAQLNLYNELTDSLPDLFWDSRHELGLEGYYDHVGKALDVGVRIKVLNEKMDYAQEIASVLRETLSERHSLRLEWGIIVLIFIEVVFEFTQRWKEYREKGDEKSIESLLRKYLERATPDRG